MSNSVQENRSMPDTTDDWMNPSRSYSWQSPPAPKPGTIHYVILRKKAIPVTGNVGAIYQWHQWSKHDTAAERDKELERLRTEHPMWRLRARDIDAYAEHMGWPQQDED